jgi:hypothetical protein
MQQALVALTDGPSCRGNAMSVWWAVLVFGTAMVGLVSKWMVLRFLRRAHDKDGLEGLKTAADALRRVRAWNSTRELTAKRLRRIIDRPG